jgi:telomere length regulation protein
MADFLTAVSTRKVKDAEPLIREVESLNIQEDAVPVNSAASALGALKSQPSWNTVTEVLRYLTTDGFSLLLPESLNASIAHQLVNDTIPNYWETIKKSVEAKLLVQVLRNPTGLGHILTRLRSLIADSGRKQVLGGARDTTEHISDALDILELILQNKGTSHHILQDVLAFGKNLMQKKLIWREYLAQVASGRILSVAAEAEDILKQKERPRTASWVADGNDYAAWLGHNVAFLMQSGDQSEEYLASIVELCSKALGLGYTGMSAQL